MKMSFDVEIPDEINWVAQDEDGKWFGYPEEPDPDSFYGYWEGLELVELASGPIPEDYTKELYEIIR